MTCEDNTALLTTIAASGLLIVSEILPYLSQVKGNGIIAVILEVAKKIVVQKPTTGASVVVSQP